MGDTEFKRPLEHSLEMLSEAIQRLEANIDALGNRLRPVLNNEPLPTDPDGDMEDSNESHTSTVVSTINSHREWLGRLTNDLNTLNYRLDV